MKKKRSTGTLKWKLIFKGQLEDFSQEHSLRYWSAQSSIKKFKEVSALIKQANFIKNKTVINGQKFLKATAVIKRV